MNVAIFARDFYSMLANNGSTNTQNLRSSHTRNDCGYLDLDRLYDME